MDAWQALIVAVAGLIAVITLTGRYLLNRLKELENKDKAASKVVLGERDELRRRVTDLEAQVKLLKTDADKVPGLEQQVGTVTRELGDLRKRYDEEASASARLRDRVAGLEEENRDLRVTNAALERALLLVGQQRTADSKAGADQPPETNEAREGASTREGEQA